MVTVGQAKRAFVDTIGGEPPWDTEEACEAGFWEFVQELTGVPYHHPLDIDVLDCRGPKPDDDVALVGLLGKGTQRLGWWGRFHSGSDEDPRLVWIGPMSEDEMLEDFEEFRHNFRRESVTDG